LVFNRERILTVSALLRPTSEHSAAAFQDGPTAGTGERRRAHGSCRTIEDAELMRRVGDGDRGAFEALYDRHAPVVLGVARRMVGGDRAAAEDVAQEAFLTLWRSRGAYTATLSPPRSWLLTLTRNRAIDALRRRHGQVYEPLGADHDQRAAPDHTENEVLLRTDCADLRTALAALPGGQRRVLELSYFSDLSQSEIATELRLPLGTVKSRMRLGLTKLGLRLAEPGRAPTPARTV
jgi:RNA polymerase sigma-70 factor, ECF subfamily